MLRPTMLLPERAYRWNFTVMGLEMSLFSFAISFASVYGIMPLFVHHLAASNVAIGLISAIRSAGFLIPPIFVARIIERRRHKKPFVIGLTTMERLPYLVLAVTTPLLAVTHPGVMLWVFFAMIAVSSLFGGIATPAWMDLIARMMPADWRGRFFGTAAALGGLLSVAGGAGAAELLHRFSWPNGFALCFACTFAVLVVSFVLLGVGREPSPAMPESPRARSDGYWRRLPTIVRNDRNFARYLAAMALLNLATMATSFYTVDAERSFHLSDAGAGVYAIVLLAASTLGNVIWGYLGDHQGHKRVVEGAAICTALAALLAIMARDPHWGLIGYGGVFLLIGLGSSGFQLASLTYIIDVAPDAERPTYIGIATVAQAPFGVGAPLLGGAIADHAGYATVFALTTALAFISAAIMIVAVVDPRVHARR